MFTGIVEEIGRVNRLERRGMSAVLGVAAQRVLEGTRIGDSINVNGSCLTVTELAAGYFTVDLSPETLKRTNLGKLRPSSRVNLERALAVGSRMGGHFVQGHIDDIGVVRALRPEGEAIIVTFDAPPGVMRYVVPKGYIAVDGMSVTVVDRLTEGFTISFIPHTLATTVAGTYRAGTPVNLEADILGKYVERSLQERESGQGISFEFLTQHGFIG